MEKTIARKLLPLVNNPEMMESLLAYSQYRIQTSRNFLESASSFEKVQDLQAVIREMRRFETLREEVLEGAK